MTSSPASTAFVRFRHSLRFKTLIFAGGILVIMVFVAVALLSGQLLRTFSSLQKSLVHQQVERFLVQLQHIGSLKVLLIHEYAEWDETYAFVGGQNPDYLKKYFEPGVSTTQEDVLLLFDQNRRLLSCRWLGKDTPVPDQPLETQNIAHITSGNLLDQAPRLGIVVEQGRVLLLAAGPILHTDQRGPSNGWLVYGRWIDVPWLNEATDLIGMHVKDVRILPSLTQVPHPGPLRVSAIRLGDMTPQYSVAPSNQEKGDFEAWILLPILGAESFAGIQVLIPMDILDAASEVRDHLLLWGIIGAVCLIVLPLLAFELAVIRPTNRLDRDIQSLTDGQVNELPVRGNNEISRLAISVNQLIRSERLANEKLQESEARFRDAMHYSAIGMAIVNLDGQWLEVNAEVCRFLGYTAQELRALNYQQLTFQDDLDADLSLVRDLVEGKIGVLRMEKRYVRKDGALVWGLLNATLVRDSEGKPLYFISQIMDIGDRKRADEELRQAKENADRANHAKSDFLTTMSHEIRTPLHGVVGFTSLLRQTALNPEQKEIVDGIEQSGKLLLGLVTEVLDLSRIESGHLVLEERVIDLPDLLRSTARSSELEAQAKGLTFRCTLSPDLPRHIVSDSLRIGQILGNLLSNALKFTSSGSIDLSAEPGTPHPDHRTEILLRVRDTGIGISPEQQEKLFQAYAQADASLARRFGGTGLGLHIVRRLCEAMQGDIRVESREGEGSTFTARIVVKIANASDIAADHLASTPTHGQLDAAIGKRVLVAEDHALNQKLLRRLLEKIGCEVFTASNGRECVDALDSGSFDLILMDVDMPEMTGLEATRLIRERETAGRYPRHHIVALSAGVTSSERNACAAAGMDDFLGKPFTDTSLRTLLRRTFSLEDPQFPIT